MIDPTKGASEETLRRLRDESYERFRLQLFKSFEQLLADFEMTWDDLARVSGYGTGDFFKNALGTQNSLTLFDLNTLAAIFSAEPYVVFRPRFPWTQS
jgi:hypothetical protein